MKMTKWHLKIEVSRLYTLTNDLSGQLLLLLLLLLLKVKGPYSS